MENPRFADLHLHTRHSDGAHAPGKVVELAAGLGFTCVAITDHDTVAGYEEAARAGAALGVEVITGIEVSTSFHGESVHILGYFFDPGHESILRIVAENQKGRLSRMERMVGKLNTLGIPARFDEVMEFTGRRGVGRMALARYLVAKGMSVSVERAFTSLIGDHGPAFEPMERFTPDQAIGLIASAGGASSLAHPGGGLDEGDLAGYVEAGLDAIEVYNPCHDDAARARLYALARRFGLAVTGGSDCHGEPGGAQALGAVRLPCGRVEELQQRAAAAGAWRRGREDQDDEAA